MEAEYKELEHRILEAELKRNKLKEKVEGLGLFRRSVQGLLTLPAVEEAASLADCFTGVVADVGYVQHLLRNHCNSVARPEKMNSLLLPLKYGYPDYLRSPLRDDHSISNSKLPAECC